MFLTCAKLAIRDRIPELDECFVLPLMLKSFNDSVSQMTLSFANLNIDPSFFSGERDQCMNMIRHNAVSVKIMPDANQMIKPLINQVVTTDLTDQR
jgi:hypothetical protein